MFAADGRTRIPAFGFRCASLRPRWLRKSSNHSRDSPGAEASLFQLLRSPSVTDASPPATIFDDRACDRAADPLTGAAAGSARVPDDPMLTKRSPRELSAGVLDAGVGTAAGM